MTLAELISRYTWPAVEPVYLGLYPKEKRRRKSARGAFDYIRSRQAAPCAMRICLEYRVDEEEGYHDVLGRNGSLREDRQGERFGLFLMDWDEWLGMEIEAKTIEKYSELDILCHCFWEMTWCGYSMEKVNRFRKRLERLSKSKKEDFIPFDPSILGEEGDNLPG
jgi:hypothetical protein